MSSPDIRALLAATRLAFRADPSTFTKKTVGLNTRDRLLAQMKIACNNDLRADEEALPAPVKHERDLFLEQQGRAIFFDLTKPAGKDRSAATRLKFTFKSASKTDG